MKLFYYTNASTKRKTLHGVKLLAPAITLLHAMVSDESAALWTTERSGYFKKQFTN